MNEIPVRSMVISEELRTIDCRTPGRLLEHYERCSEGQRLEYVAALAVALCVSEQRRRAAK